VPEFEKLTPFAFRFFDQNLVFQKIAIDCGDKHYFLTGGTGLFGTWILMFFEWCHERGLSHPRVTALTRRDVLPHRKFITTLNGKTESFQFPDECFDRLIHLAAPSARDTFEGMGDRDKLQQMYLGTQNVLNFSAKKVSGRCLFTSSGAVYGGLASANHGLISEGCQLAPLSKMPGIGLGLGKRIAEFLIAEYVRDGSVDAGVARCFSFIGPGLPIDLHYALGNFVGAALNGHDITINGDGTPIRSFMDLGDAVYWLMTILEYGESGDDFNVGSTHAVSIYELAQMVRDLVNPKVNITVTRKSNLSPGNPANYFYVPDTTKARQKLGLMQSVKLEESIKIYAQFLST